MEAEVFEVASTCLPMSQRHLFKTPIPINAELMCRHANRQSVLKTAVSGSMMGTHRGRSLWISTVWWWLQSLSAAGRWSDLPSQWSTPPHSWESKPSGSTRLPLQWGTRNRKSSTAYVSFTCFSSISLFIEVKKQQQHFIHSYKDRLLEWMSGWKCWSLQTEQSHANATSLHKNWTVLPPQKPTPPEQSIQA